MASKSYYAAELQNILNTFSQDVEAEFDIELERISKEAAKKVKAASPKRTTSQRHYATGWTWKKEFKNHMNTFIVYNKTKPGLAHLLENGHIKVNGGRTKAIEHIKPVEEWANQEAINAAAIAVQRARG